MQQISSFILYTGLAFLKKKNANPLLVFFNWVPYMQISDMISGVNIISGKVSIASVNGAGGVLRPQCGHIDWLKTNLNKAKKITILDYKQKNLM